MTNIRDFIWLLPFAGAILTVISIFTPAKVIPLGSYIVFGYMDGLYLRIGGGAGLSAEFSSIPIILIIGIIATTIIVISTIILFFSALTNRSKKIPSSWIVLGIFLIAATIFYIGGSEVGFTVYTLIHYGVPLSFWQDYIPSFAVIAPFIGGGLSILGSIIGKTMRKEKVDITPISKEIPSVSRAETPISEPISESIPIEESHRIRFCPACGEKIPNVQAHYCPACGYDLKKD